MNLRIWFFLLSFSILSPLFAQLNQPPQNWQLLDKLADGYMGVSAEKSYKELLKGKKSQTVVVAVIDGGVDPLHEDLKDVMWVNIKEIPGNGIDDDANGYVDDIHGWNFLGNKNGQNVNYDQLEITRLYVTYHERFKNADPAKLSKKDKKLYEKYKEIGQHIEKERQKASGNFFMYNNILNAVMKIEQAIGKEEIQIKDLEKFKSEDGLEMRAAQILMSLMAEGSTFREVKDQIQDGVNYFKGKAEYNYNPDINMRKIIGDNYADPFEKGYGNNDVKGPDASHGTHVAGIIAAKRNNCLGIDGIADNVKIMAIRAVPNGDEYDKDVANAILYAVDNGASIINMSFGKSYSWDKKAVDRAVRYAMKKDVLLIHAAGNDSKNNDKENNFPNPRFEKVGLFGAKKAKNWIEVGALNWREGEEMAAEFSNYGKKNVDLFAPGVDIYSTMPDNGYKRNNGTSMAAPAVSGVAALIRSYYPELTACQVRDVIMSSTVMTRNAKVKIPGTEEVVPFSELCVTGGAVNAYEALKKAATVKGKKKITHSDSTHDTGKKGRA